MKRLSAESDLALRPGEHFEGTVPLEGTEQTVHYEAIRNDALGFEMGYDYENFVRQSEADCERFISVWDNPDNPEIYLEITHSSDDAETTAVSSPGGITHRKAPRAVERASAV